MRKFGFIYKQSKRNEGSLSFPSKQGNQECKFLFGRIAQLVEQLPLKQTVAGSNPAAPTRYGKSLKNIS